MLSKKVKSRMIFLIFSLLLATVIIFFIFKSLEENVVYFFSPTEIYNKPNISLNEKIRIGGLVKENSLSKSQKSIKFIITDLKNEIIVSYNGPVPNLFSEKIKSTLLPIKFWQNMMKIICHRRLVKL